VHRSPSLRPPSIDAGASRPAPTSPSTSAYGGDPHTTIHNSDRAIAWEATLVHAGRTRSAAT
jgi:hypothetical protein